MNNITEKLNETMEYYYNACKRTEDSNVRQTFLNQAFGAVEFAAAIDPSNEDFYHDFWMAETFGWRDRFMDLIWGCNI